MKDLAVVTSIDFIVTKILILRGERILLDVDLANLYEVIGEQTIADAILDRIVHDAQRLELKGESMRKKRSNLLEEMTEDDN